MTEQTVALKSNQYSTMFKASTDFKRVILPAPEENKNYIKTIKDKNDNLKNATGETTKKPLLQDLSNIWNWITSSKNTSDNDKLLELKLITEKIGNHRTEVYKITKSVESLKAGIDMFLQTMKVYTATQKVGEENSFVTYEQLNKIIKCAETLLTNIHEALLQQSETLKTSFHTLNEQVHKTFDFVRAQYCNDDSTLEQKEILPETSKSSYLQPAEGAKDLFSPELEESKYSEQKNAQQVIDEELNDLVEKQEHEIEQLKQDISNLQSENKTLQSQNADSENRFQEQLKINAEILDEITSLKSECKSLRGKKESQVQLHFEGKGELIMKAIDELKSMLVHHMGIQRRELKFIHCPSVTDVDPDIPLMVLCINVSRIGTDVQRTLHHLNASNRVALLILHHKDVHALPSQASDRVLTGVDFQSLGGIFDLAFLAEKGLYQCEMNTKAADEIVNFIHIG